MPVKFRQIHTKSLMKDPSIMHPSTFFAGEDNKEPSWAQLHNLHMHMLKKLRAAVLTRLSLALR